MIKESSTIQNRLINILRTVQAPLLAVLGGMLIGGLLMLFSGYNPLEAYGAMIQGAFAGRNLSNLFSMINRAAPIVGMGLAAAVAFRAGFFNIGGEGQLVLGGVTAALVALYVPLPGLLLVPLVFLGAALAGGLYAGLATFLQVRLSVPLLIGTLLLNYPARFFASYLVTHPFRDVPSGMNQSYIIAESVRLPRLFTGSQLHWGVVLTLVLVLGAAFVISRTVAGYNVRMTGLNARFSRYGGVDTRRLGYRVMLTSGAIAGLVGAIEVLGIHFRYIDGSLVMPVYAWTGVMAALLSNSSPLGVLLAGLFFSAVQTGGFGMERGADVPRELAQVIQAIIIMLVAARASFHLGSQLGGEVEHD